MYDTLSRLSSMPAQGEYDLWVCLTCADRTPMASPAFVEHLRDTHRQSPIGTFTLALTSDGWDFAVNVFAWTLGEVEAEQFVRVARPWEDREAWRDLLEATP